MLRGLMIGDYRSIGENQRIGPLGKINLFVGPNNAGKSNILRFVNYSLRGVMQVIRGDSKGPMPSEPHIGRGKPTQAGVCVSLRLESLQELLRPPDERGRKLVEAIHNNIAQNDLLWIDHPWPDQQLIEAAARWASQDAWYHLWTRLTNHTGGGLKGNWIPEILRYIKQQIPQTIIIFAVPIDRQAGREAVAGINQEVTRFLAGRDAITALAAMENPQYVSYDESRKKFSEIEDFVRTVTDDPAARITVPHTHDMILVQTKGQRFLPLADLGSGIEQVVLHAVAVSSASGALVTFEEPELHLHPVLQRQLMTFLATKTSNQYFISTHSAHLIDALHADTFHVRLVDSQTVIEKAITDAQRHQVCQDLGYRPSDIVQSNCVIWVEGPSDRIYVRHWIKQLDKHLTENVHFSIMFYGGKLLSHLSAGETDAVDDGLKDLIPLRLLNRHVAVIIDSDRATPVDEIRETKRRVRDEISQHGGFVWITAGREVENYIPEKVLTAAVELVKPGRGSFVKADQFEKALPSATPDSDRTVDKVETASRVEEAGCPLDVLDLRERLQELSTFIRKANGLGPRVD